MAGCAGNRADNFPGIWEMREGSASVEVPKALENVDTPGALSSALATLGNAHGSNRDFYQARVARYSVGSEATCHVNPRDASEAVLEKIEPETWFGWLGLLVIPTGVFVVWSHLANERRLAQLSASG